MAVDKTRFEPKAEPLKFDNLEYSTTGLTSTKGTISSGGYCKIGKLIIVNIRLDVTSTINTGDVIITGLPLAKGSVNCISLNTNLPNDAAQLQSYGYSSGTIQVFGSTVSSGDIKISGLYLSN